MLSKREEERNEKIIRGLMKLPPNRRCINCNSLGPQYVCTNFWTFVCMTCSGIHREFTHRVKSVSMAKFTTQEVEVLQRGGNQRAREMFLKDWDTQRMRLPDSSNADKIREFIKNVYVHKKYAGGKSSDKPPRDLQSLKNHEEYQRKASSYHSFSQSPPYEHQYEDRRYGKKQTITLTRRPGSDRGLFGGTVSSFVYSPGHLREHMHEEKFANESSGSRFSDYSESSTGDPFRYDSQSPNFQDSGHGSPTLHQVRDIFVENAQPQMFNKYSDANVKRDLGGISCPQRTASAGSFGSIDSNSESNKSVNSGNAISAVLEPEHPTGTQRATASTFPYLSQSSTSRPATNQDLVCLPFVQPSATSSAPMLDLFADISHQPSSTTFLEQKPSAVSFSANEGWATFDLPQPAGSASETNKGVSAMVTPSDGAPKGTEDALASMLNNSQWFSVQSSAVLGPFTSATDQLHIGLHEDKRSADQKGSQSWNAFDDSTGNMPHTSFGSLPQKNELQIPVWKSPTSDDPYIGLKTSEDLFNNKFRKSALDDTVPGLNLPSTGVSRSSFPPSVLPPTAGTSHAPKSTNPFDIPYDLDSEANNAFLDMSSLQAALPNPQLPTAFLGGLPQQWFPQSSVSQGGLAYMAGQPPRSQLPNLPPQGSVASLGGNPFA